MLGQAVPAPYPFVPYFGVLPVYSIGPVFYLDNRADTVSERMFELDQEGGFGMSLLSSPSLPGAVGTNSGTTNLFCTSLTNFAPGYQTNNNLALGISVVSNCVIGLTTQTPPTNASYDLFGTTNLNELVAAIEAYLAQRNLSPKPYRWRAKGADILAKIQRAKAAQTLHHGIS